MALTTTTASANQPIAVDNMGAAGLAEIFKLGYSALGSSSLVQADATGLLVNIGTVSAGSIPVSALATAPAFVRLSNGTTAVDTIPVSGTVTASAVAGSPVAVRLSTGAAFIDTIPISGSVSITGTPNVAIPGGCVVSGTVTSNQGTAAATAAAWPIKVTDGTNTSALQNVSGIFALPVKVLAQAGGGFSMQDKTAFTEGTTFVEVAGGVFNDAFSGDVGAGQASCSRITAKRALHTNLRRNDGTEIGVTGQPLIVVGNTGGNLPVQGTVTAKINDASGNPLTQANPLPVQNAPSTGFWKAHVAITAGQTAQAIRTPTGGKTTYVEGYIITLSTGGPVTIFDGANTATTILYSGTLGVTSIVVTPSRPIPLAAINNVLQYTTGAGSVGDISAWGFEQ